MLTSVVLPGQQGSRLRLFAASQPTTGSLGKLTARGPELFAHPVHDISHCALRVAGDVRA